MIVIEPDALLILPHLQAWNVDTISGPLTWGFPSIASFMDLQHDISRCLANEFDVTLDGIGIISHAFDASVSRPSRGRYRVLNALQRKLGDVEYLEGVVGDGRANLEISLILGVNNLTMTDPGDLEHFALRAWEVTNSLQLAGGHISFSGLPKPELILWPESSERVQKVSRRIALELLPGHALVSREGALDQRLTQLRKVHPNVNSLDVLLEFSSRRVEPLVITQNGVSDDSARTEGIEWRARRRSARLVPIPVGYASIYPVRAAEETIDDNQSPFRFVENLFSLGQWLSPHRVWDMRNLLWQASIDSDEGVYRFSTPFYAADPMV
ncbi:type I-F CRISPR-associated protein Csy2 [Rhodanobacter sp. Col0626]|uniref:type I-F CRISPR-associated protein Csy2 n=1 Tax=Rhodanobacter sp. Col0626 TaxID=3415679 RepID=UPI003CEC121E